MRQFILDSFVSKKGGGNKAAVVIDDIGLTEKAMLEIARINNYSETAFIDLNGSTDEEFLVRYFTPTEEVDICGHAALASFTVLRKMNYFNAAAVYHRTKAGKLRVQLNEDQILIEMKKPEVIKRITYAEIAGMINLPAEEIVLHDDRICVISTGLPDIILEVNSLEALKRLAINREEMISYCNGNNVLGMHVVSRETIEGEANFCCRNFAPAVGIDEESATGTSNASMLYYMHINGEAELNRAYMVEQGYFMNSPSNIFVKAEKEKDDIVLFVGGKASIIDEMDLKV